MMPPDIAGWNRVALIGTFARADDGAALTEYGIILGVLMLAAGGAALSGLGTGTRDRLETAGQVVAVTGPGPTQASGPPASSCPGRSCEAKDASRSGGVGSR